MFSHLLGERCFLNNFWSFLEGNHGFWAIQPLYRRETPYSSVGLRVARDSHYRHAYPCFL